MKYLTLLCIIILAYKGTSRKTTGNAGIEEQEASTTECFLNIRGRDTSTVLLNSSRDSVSGMMSYVPFEKDSRKGEIKGIIKNGIIKVQWTFTQEGMRNTLPVEFKIKNNGLLQRNYSVNPETGREFLTDTAAFGKAFKKVACK